MKMKLVLTFVLVLVLTLGFTISAAADHGATMITLSNHTPVSGTIQGFYNGEFWYANLIGSGENKTVRVDMNITPADPKMVNGVGFNLYDLDKRQLVGSGALVSPGLMELTFTSSNSDLLLLQVYNYVTLAVLYFTVTVNGQGLPSAPITVVTAPTPASATGVQVMSGTLMGSFGGAFARYTITFNTDNPVTLDMNYAPANELISRGVGVTVYGPGGEVDTRVATGEAGHAEVVFTPVAGQQYLVLVQNYNDGLPVSFNIESSVIPASITAAN